MGERAEWESCLQNHLQLARPGCVLSGRPAGECCVPRAAGDGRRACRHGGHASYALDTARPLAVPDIAATMRWPGFRDTAYRLGSHTSLSIPLFTGSGEPIAALNLYGRDPITMTFLTAPV